MFYKLGFLAKETDERPVRFYSPQFETYVKSQETYLLWIERIVNKNLAEIYLYCIMETGMKLRIKSF